MIERLALIGTGLIGGSITLAARKAGFVREVTGFDQNSAHLDAALSAGIIDRVASSIEEAVQHADLIVIAVPVGAMPAVLAELRPCWNADAVYTDVGSTKLNVIESLVSIFGFVPENFVPGHPIAGLEQSGPMAATPALFDKKRVILTPTLETRAEALSLVVLLWEALGARVSEMEPGQHDEILAATSHLPHVLAFALTDMLGTKDETVQIFKYAAGGFRDFSRIASSDPRMWRDICLANRDALVPLIQEYCAVLSRTAAMLQSGDSIELQEHFAHARSARQRFLDQFDQ